LLLTVPAFTAVRRLRGCSHRCVRINGSCAVAYVRLPFYLFRFMPLPPAHGSPRLLFAAHATAALACRLHCVHVCCSSSRSTALPHHCRAIPFCSLPRLILPFCLAFCRLTPCGCVIRWILPFVYRSVDRTLPGLYRCIAVHTACVTHVTLLFSYRLPALHVVTFAFACGCHVAYRTVTAFPHAFVTTYMILPALCTPVCGFVWLPFTLRGSVTASYCCVR